MMAKGVVCVQITNIKKTTVLETVVFLMF